MAARRRAVAIASNVEPEIYVALQHLLAKTGMSASGYVRSLLLRDLTARGLITDETIIKIAERIS